MWAFCDQSIRHMPFPIGVPLEPILNHFRDICTQIYLGHDLTILGHVTSSVMWPIDPPYAISY